MADKKHSPVIENRQQLIDHLAAGCKPPERWRIGTEHEKFAYHLDTLRPLDYEGEVGVRALLNAMTRFGWRPVMEGNNPIALVTCNRSRPSPAR